MLQCLAVEEAGMDRIPKDSHFALGMRNDRPDPLQVEVHASTCNFLSQHCHDVNYEKELHFNLWGLGL